MNKIELIEAIVKTLDSIPVTGFENSQKMIGVYHALQQLKEEGEEEDVDLPESK